MAIKPLISFDFSPNITEFYVEGGCSALAVALSAKTGYPIYGITDDNTKLVDRYNPWHYVVKTPDEKYVDIMGVWNRKEMLAWWYEYLDIMGREGDLVLYPISDMSKMGACKKTKLRINESIDTTVDKIVALMSKGGAPRSKICPERESLSYVEYLAVLENFFKTRAQILTTRDGVFMILNTGGVEYAGSSSDENIDDAIKQMVKYLCFSSP